MTQPSKPRFQSSRASPVQASLLSSNGSTISRASCAVSNPGQQHEISGLAQAPPRAQRQLLNAPVALDAALLHHTKTHQPVQATAHGRRSCQIEKQPDPPPPLRHPHHLVQERLHAAQPARLPACHNVGVSYEQGRNGVNQDYAEATSYFLQAAERAFLPSIYNLAVLSAESKISAADYREGLKWMLVAQKSAVQSPESPTCKTVTDDPKGYRKQLESRLSSKEIRETYKLADDWRPRN